MSTKLIGGTFAAPNSRRWESAPLHPFWFELPAPVETQIQITPSEGAAYDHKDASVRDSTSAGNYNEFQFSPVKEIRSADETISFLSLNTGRATVDSSGKVSNVSAGAVTIRTASTSRTIDTLVTMTSTGGSTIKKFQSWRTGTLAKAMTDRLDALLVGKTKAANAPMFTTLRANGLTYVRNVNFWGKDLPAKTAIAAWSSSNLFGIGRTAITPRHVITCAHSYTHNGVTLEFVDDANVVHSRTVIRTNQIFGTDVLVLTLSADLPASITPMKFLPANALSYLGNYNEQIGVSATNFRLPLVWVDQAKQFLVQDLQFLTTPTVSPVNQNAYFVTPTDTQRLAFYEVGVSGDSGHPSMFILGNDLVLFEGHTGSTAGPFYPIHLSAINSAIAAMDANAGITSGYQVQTVDLSAYPTY